MLNLINKLINGYKSIGQEEWISVTEPPSPGKRVLVKSADGEVHVGHIDIEAENLWIAFTIEISGKVYKFQIKEPLEWKTIPK